MSGGSLRFAKWQGLGNDYLIVRERDVPAGGLDAEQVQAICDRHFGVGGDGILVLGDDPGGEADAAMRIHNPDGSQAEMCGNGIRMAARWLVEADLVTPGPDGSFAIVTAGGTMRPRIDPDGRVRVDMGTVRSEGHDSVTLPGALGEWRGRLVDVGNPHFVVFVDPETVDLPNVGSAIERHTRFPNRTNVEFVAVEDPSHVRMRVWERGVGETLACGTGACAVGVAAVLDAGCSSPVTVRLPGGDLEIEVTDDLHVHMTGPATQIYTGQLDLAALVAEARRRTMSTTRTAAAASPA